jgi:predicted Fe-Mo cluster-binding NifX family protein
VKNLYSAQPAAKRFTLVTIKSGEIGAIHFELNQLSPRGFQAVGIFNYTGQRNKLS